MNATGAKTKSALMRIALYVVITAPCRIRRACANLRTGARDILRCMDRNLDHGEEVVNVAVMIQRVMAE